LTGTVIVCNPEELAFCPGFSWDRVNFHKKLGGMTQTANQMGGLIPCDIMLGIKVGELAGAG